MNTDINELNTEALALIVMAGVTAVLAQGGYMTISVVGSIAEINISKVPIEVTLEETVPVT